MNLQNNEINFSEGKNGLKCTKEDISMCNDIKQQPIKTIINEVQFNDLLNVMQYLPINNSYQPNLFNYDFLNNTPNNNNINNSISDSLQYNSDYCFNPFINDINMSMAMATNPFYNLINSLTDSTSIDFNNNNTSGISTNSIVDIGDNSNTLNPATNNIIHKANNSPYQVIYSGSGFDLLQILNKVINRPSPLIRLGPVDMDCAFIVADALKFDFPIVYSSPSFEKLTGYAPNEILGRNCRFLQAPNGHVTLGSRRRYTDNNAVHCIKSSVNNLKEYQISILNYKKDGTPFLNLISIIPVYENERIRYFVGFQADIVAKTVIPSGTKYGYEGANGTSVNTSYKLQQYKQPSVNLKEHLLDTSVMNNPSDADNIDINQLLLDNSPDLIQVLSIKGIFLYISTNSIDLIGYPNQQLIGRPISTICHPADLIPLTRELKECSINEKPFSLIYRIKDDRNNRYSWMESEGKLHADSAKGRRCIILSSRVRELYQIPKNVIENYGGLNEESVWFKLSLRGLILYVTNNSYNILGKESECLLGSSFYQFFEPNSTLFLSNALDTITNGNNCTCSLEHEFASKKGKLQLMSYFYSNSFNNKDQLQFILCQIKVKKQGEVELPAMMFSNNTCNENSSLFPYLDCTYSSSWQYEIHQLKNANKKLEEQIEECLSKKQSFKKLKTGKNKSRICHNCHRTQSPEWRKGPDGPKTLCNSCGLKYAKSQSPCKSRSNTSTDTSSNSGHDSFHPSCSSSSNSP